MESGEAARQAQRARAAGGRLAATPADLRNRLLLTVADAIEARAAQVLAVNAEDVAEARSTGVKPALVARLALSPKKMAEIVTGVRDTARLPDPLGAVLRRTQLDDGLELELISVPIGLIGVIFESRPDALVQISALALKSGNAAILKGGSEATRTNSALHGLIVEAVRSVRTDLADALQLVGGRAEMGEMLALEHLIDLVIPRGSNELVRAIKDQTRIPVLGHTEGVCHLYVDAAADLDMAVEIAWDAKCQYPAVCNAIETLLVHRAVAPRYLPAAAARLAGVELRCDGESRPLMPGAVAAAAEDWRAEYNDLILAVRVVGSLQEAIDHVNTYGSHHTDAIVTADEAAARTFLDAVDSASVMWNCSTRFADGYRYGLGAEVGISTNKIHARGPVGLEGLTIHKYRVVGSGHTVKDYVDGKRRFTHRRLV
jgi:glutamate-5-semialdehyde dehydrogenase